MTTIIFIFSSLICDIFDYNLTFLYIETREIREKRIEHLTSLVKTKEDTLIQHQSQVQCCQYFTLLVINFILILYKAIERRYCHVSVW